MKQKQRHTGPNPWRDLADTVARSHHIQGKYRVEGVTLVTPIRRILEAEKNEADGVSDKLGEVVKYQWKKNSRSFRKDPHSLKSLNMVILEIIYELRDYQSRTSFLLRLILDFVASIAETVETELIGKDKNVAKNLRLQIASEVLRSGALEKEIQRAIRGDLRRSRSELLPYVK